jgi:H/ACA ribonucleoprotein complex non-core subunit NAF1
MSVPHMDTEKMDLDLADTNATKYPTNSTDTNEDPVVAEPAGPSAPVATTTDHVPNQADGENVERQPSPALTGALEALLGGLDPPTPIALEAPADAAESTTSASLRRNGDIPAQTDPNSASPPVINNDNIPLEGKYATNELAVAIADGNETLPTQTEQSALPDGDPPEEEHPEWEVDSSPIESSTDDSSSDDSSSDESEEGQNSYKLLSPEEQARILMQEGGGSDDEDGGKGTKGAGSGYRTKNEIVEAVIPKPDVTITEDMPIKEIGNVENVIDNIALIKAKTSGEYQVLESGSVLCLENRSVIGVVSETIGRVQQPFYSVMFTNASELAEAGVTVGIKVFYPEKHATFVFTQALKAYKGSDASNLHDEEVGADEMEFSDDEAEAEHKRKVKQARLDRRGGRIQHNGASSRGGHPLQHNNTYDPSKGISYDDAEDDGPYRTLSRPPGFANSNGHSEAPQEGQYLPGMNVYSQNQYRDQLRGRGRGDRGRGRGDRGRGRGGHHKERRGGGNNGYSQSPQAHQSAGQVQSQSTFQQPQFSPQAGHHPQFQSFPQNLAAVPSFGSNSEYSPSQPQLPGWPSFVPPPPFPPPPFQQSFPNMPNIPNIPNGGLANPAASGTFVNPAFFSSAQQGNQNQNSWSQNQRGRGSGGQ